MTKLILIVALLLLTGCTGEETGRYQPITWRAPSGHEFFVIVDTATGEAHACSSKDWGWDHHCKSAAYYRNEQAKSDARHRQLMEEGRLMEEGEK
jgi:hypothetical protein